jgi:hypothetical protein
MLNFEQKILCMHNLFDFRIVSFKINVSWLLDDILPLPNTNLTQKLKNL